jgi:hypothetical protein
MKSKGWTDERRAKRAADCRAAKLWQNSTGPKTDEGKAASSQNALKHGMRNADARELDRVLKIHNDFLKSIASKKYFTILKGNNDQ